MPRTVFSRRSKMNIRWIVLGLCIVPAAALFSVPTIYPDPLHDALRLAAFRLSLIFHVLSFAIVWNTFGEQLKRGTIIIATALLGSAILEFLYLSTSLGTASFLPLREATTATPFLIAAHFLTAIGIFWAALAAPTEIIKRRRAYLLLAAMLIALACYITIVITNWKIPTSVTMLISADTLKASTNYFSAGFFLIAAVLFFPTSRTPHASAATEYGLHRIDIFSGTCALFVAQVFFMSSLAAGTVINVIGPICQLIAALFLYRGIAASSIKLPYRALSQLTKRLQIATDALHASQTRLAAVIDTATDAIITIDDQQVVIMANPAAAAMFGITQEKMQGSAIEKYVPRRHQRRYQWYMKNLGHARISFMKMSKTLSGHEVIGIRHNGEEFPIEASLSTMIEHHRRFYTLILRDITERKQIEAALAKSHEELMHLSGALQNVREEERRSVAKDLHDNLGQLLATLRNDLSLLQQRSEDVLASEKLSGMDDLLTSSITSLRRIATELRPRALDEGGLYFALQTLLKEFSVRRNIACKLIADEDELALDDQRSTLLYRLVQDSLATIFSHGDATKITVECKRNYQRIDVTICGEGHRMQAIKMKKEVSIGIVNMRERLRTMRGEITIVSDDHSETRIAVMLPIEAQETKQQTLNFQPTSL